MNGDEVKARRHAREIVQDLRWNGMTVPPLYGHMAWAFQELVDSGEYAAWVAGGWRLRPLAAAPERELPPDPSRPPRAGRIARPRRHLPGPVLGR